MAKKDDEDKKEAAVTGVERDILKELRETVQATGASGFHFRVQKKMDSGPMSFVGHLDGATEDIPQALLDKWKEGQYRVYAHFNDKKKVPNVPPLDYTVGDLSRGTTEKEPASKRIKEMDEEIEVKKRERELRRTERELRRMEKEDGEPEDEVMEAFKGFEMELDALRKENEALKVQTREDKLMEQIAALKKQMEDGGSHRRDPELEALKVRLAVAEETARKSEMESMKRGFEGQINELKMLLTNQSGNKWNPKDYVAAAAPFVPALTAWIEKSAGGKKEALEIVEKVTGVFSKQPKGMDLKEIIPLVTPFIMPFLNRKDESIPAILGLVGNLVGPMVEAAADAASHPAGDDLGQNITKVIGLIQRSISDTKDLQSKSLEVEKTRLKTAKRLTGTMPQQSPPPQMAGAPQPRAIPGPQQQQGAPRPQQRAPGAPPQQQQQRPAPAPARASRGPMKGITPLVRFVNRISLAIAEQDEEVEFYVGMAEKELPKEDLDRFGKYDNTTMFASYLGSLPGTDGSAFQTTYGKRWLETFLSAIRGDAEPVTPPPPVAKPVTPPVVAPTPVPAVAAPAPVVARDSDHIPSNIKLNEFQYPPDSRVDVVNIYDLDLPIEYPTEATVALREADRKVAMEEAKAKREPEVAARGVA